MTLDREIKNAFASRARPDVLLVPTTRSPSEIADVEHFAGKDRYSLSCEEIDNHRDAIFHFSAEAFCHFLPGIMLAGLATEQRDMLVYDSLVQTLDRSPNVDYWDEWFLQRWPLLTIDECTAIQHWVVWLAEDDDLWHASTLDRCLDTLELLSERASSTA